MIRMIFTNLFSVEVTHFRGSVHLSCVFLEELVVFVILGRGDFAEIDVVVGYGAEVAEFYVSWGIV